MKYIKEYNTYDDISPIEELSEYLQEFLDKYNVPQGSNKNHGNIEPHEGLFWYTFNVNIGSTPYSWFYVVNIPEDIHDDMKAELKRIRPMIEKRMNSQLNIGFEMREYIVISLK